MTPVARPTSPVEIACAKLQAAGLRLTQPRRAILAALIKRGQPTSIEDIHHDLGSAEQCDLVTVYRCMAAFEEIGLVRRAYFNNGTSLYDINLGEPTKYHVVCKRSNNVTELDTETANELRQTLERVEQKLRALGYDNVNHVVEFFGVAPQGGRIGAHAQAPAAPTVR